MAAVPLFSDANTAASLHRVFFKCGNVFFNCFVRTICSKESQSFAFDKAFLCPWWVTRCKERVLDCLRWFEVRYHIEMESTGIFHIE